MTLPVGQISMSQVNVELSQPATQNISLGQTNVRVLAGVPTGAISMHDLQGKSSETKIYVNSNEMNMNLHAWALAHGWNGTAKLNVIIGDSIAVWSNSTSVAAITVDGTYPNGLLITNNGWVMGCGGNGGDIDQNGSSGGSAISIYGVNITIQNNLYIGGGGGGGGGAGGNNGKVAGGGGGAGGGKGGDGWAAGGAGGAVGQTGADGQIKQSEIEYNGMGGGGGGRIFPGTGGAGGVDQVEAISPARGGGAGGGGGTGIDANLLYGIAGGGGGWGAAGGTGGYTEIDYLHNYAYGGAGGAGNAGGGNGSPGLLPRYSGGAGGKCIALNACSVTTLGTGYYWGAIS